MEETMKKTALSGSDFDNFKIIGYIIGALVTISGGFFIWEIIANSGFSFSANWSMFDSILLAPLYIVGLIVMFANWNSLNYVIIYRLDISNVLFYNIVFPFLIRFVGIPLVVAAMIYYPLQCIIAIVGHFFPYIISIIVAGVIVVMWIWNNRPGKNSIVFTIAGILLTAGFAVGAYFIHPKSAPSYSPRIENTSTSGTKVEDFDDSDFDESEFDDSDFDE